MSNIMQLVENQQTSEFYPTPEEKAVVDSFQGAEAYAEVMAKAGYYLAPPTNNQPLMIGA